MLSKFVKLSLSAFVVMTMSACAVSTEPAEGGDEGSPGQGEEGAKEDVGEARQNVTIDGYNKVCWGHMGTYLDPYSVISGDLLKYGNSVYAYYPVKNGRVNVGVLTGSLAGSRTWVDKDGLSSSCP